MCPNSRPSSASRARSTAGEQGAVLLLVLLVLALISVLILSWAQEWRMELRLASNYREASQCRRLAEGGVYYALGKLVAAKQAEMNAATSGQPLAPGSVWCGDHRPYQVQLPEGQVEIRLEDEGGKINLNRAPGDLLYKLFLALRVPPEQIRVMVDSIQDWRSGGEQPRPYGAKSAFYLGLEPPYVAKSGAFETVEELSWVHGFEGSPMIPRLGEWLTVQQVAMGVDANTAPLQVLLGMGLPLDVAQTIVSARQVMPFRNLQEIGALVQMSLTDPSRQLTVQSSPFFTIKSTGMINKKGGSRTIRAIVRVDVSQEVPWEILFWVDDSSG